MNRVRLQLVALLLAACFACNGSSSSAREAERMPKLPEVGDDDGDPRERIVSRVFASFLEEDHVRKQALDDEVSRQAFDFYLEALDPGKVFLLQEHVDQLGAHRQAMDDELRDGNLTLSKDGMEIFRKRIKVADKLVGDRLAKPFDFTVDEQLETDSDKLEYCKSEQELAERWRKRLKLQVLARVVRMEEVAKALEASKNKKPGADNKAAGDAEAAGDAGAQPAPKPMDIPKTFAEREAKAREEVAKSYVGRFVRLGKLEALDVAAMEINAIASVYDPHTSYLPPKSKEDFNISMSGSLEGIGAILVEDDHFIRVDRIVPGGASWRQGKLKAGDLILAVAQEGEEPVDIGDMRIDKVVQMIRGPKDTVVVLTIKKPDDEIVQLPITRDVVKIESTYARGAILDRRVGYLELPGFYGNTRTRPGQTPERSCTDDIRQLLELFAAKGIDRVVLDLRDNGGGLLDDAQHMSGLLLETGPVVQTVDASGDRDVLSDEKPSISFKGHVVVLVNRFSASASEILAAAMQDYGRAVIVGTGPTHGKGTVQVIYDLDRLAAASSRKLPPLGVVKLTRQQFYRVSGLSTQWNGVTPDVVLPDPVGYVESRERTLDNSMPASKISPVPFHRWAKKWNVEALAAASVRRQAKFRVFQTVAKRNALLSARRDDTDVSLNLDSYVAERDKTRKELDAVSLKLSEEPRRFSVKIVEYGTPPAKQDTDEKAKAARDERWRDSIARDPWLAESIAVLNDMAKAR